MRSVRSVVRPLIAVFLALSCVVLSCMVLAAATAQASVQKIQQPSSRTDRADSHSLAVSITGVTPQRYATAKTSTVTVSGTLSNHTGSTIRDIQVQLQWYPLTFATRSGMDSFASGGPAVLQGVGETTLQQVGTPYQLSRALANGATARWTVSFNLPQSFLPYGYYPALGDYPLQVEASSASSNYQATSRTFLPYWPGNTAGTPLKVAWIWPLIDTPQQGACPQTLATNSLAGALAANGRLSTLLDAGLKWAPKDDLTWAIDPALLSDATVMTHRYSTGGNAKCTDRSGESPSPAAASWLTKLAGTAGQPAFLTPYANVDAAALSHAGLDADLTSAYQVGDAVASKILPDTFGSSADGTGSGTALSAAWPAGGTADAGVLTSLARSGGINTVVLNSGEMPTSTPPFDNALARTKTSTGASMSVLLADSTITGILGSASAGSSAGAQFAAVQDFLAQTAMIVAEGPNSARALVIAPPTGWDPSPAEASELLSLTRGAPWLRATDLGALATAAAKMPAKRLPNRTVSGAELSGTDGYIDQLHLLDANLTLFENVLSDPPKSYLASLAAAVAVTQSSAWRGRGSPGGWLAMTQLSSYIDELEGKVVLIPVKKILLAGTSGDTLVSVQNGLNLFYLPPPGLSIAVRVGTSAELGSSLQVTSPAAPLVVNPGMTNSVRLRIHSTTIGTTTLRLQLLTKNGSPLTWQHASEPLSVEVTRFGRLILVIIFGALGVLVLAAVLRLRRKRRRGGESEAGSDDHDASNRADSRAHAGGTG
jgi:Family of unknown function (DUF6049)